MRHLTFLLLLCLSACAPAAIPIIEETSMPPIQYLALGDSYTIGESVSASERWTTQLAALIESAPGFENRRVDVAHIAKTGWTTDELWQGIQARTIKPPYDLVSLLIGVNNQYRGRDINEYREQFVFLLGKAIEYAGGDANRVIVLSIPDWGVTPFAKERDAAQIAREIDAYNTVNKEEAENAGVHYIDITPISRTAASDPALIAEDGLHPSGRMYTLWAEQALPAALEALTADR